MCEYKFQRTKQQFYATIEYVGIIIIMSSCFYIIKVEAV